MILVDSDVLTEHLRGKTPARDWLVQARQSSGPLELATLNIRHYPMIPELQRPF